VRFLASDTPTLVGLSNRLKNLPTTKDSLASPDIAPDANFAPFLQIYANPKSEFAPLTPIGQDYTDTFGKFATRFQAGKVADVNAGLAAVDGQINDALAQAQDGTAP
jgi:multiple sugar transport system substrate-binding protein